MPARSINKLIAILILLTTLPAAAQDHWRAFPIRSLAEYNAGIIGGEAEQHMQGIARCASRPDVIYLAHDCNQVWISRDNGMSWRRPACEGMWVSAAQGIACDPIDPDKVLVIMDSSFDYRTTDGEGIYLSEDAGESWSFVQFAEGEQIRHYQATIEYDPTRVAEDGAQWWYAARCTDKLYRSTDGGHTWSVRCDLSDRTDVYSLKCHISDGQTLFMGCEDGLLVSRDQGASFAPIGNLPTGSVSAISMHPTEPDTLYATVRGVGLYRSTNGGQSFLRLYGGAVLYGILNPGHPETIFLSMETVDMRVSSDGGASWRICRTFNSVGDEISTDLDGAFTNITPDPRDPEVCTAYSHARCWRTTNGRDFHWSNTRLTGFNCNWWQDVAAFDVADPDRFVFFCFDVGMVLTENGGLWFHHRPVPYSWYTSGQLDWISMHAGDIYPEPGSDILMMAAGGTFNLKLVRSTDFGVNKTIVDNRKFTHLIVQFNRNTPSIVYAGNKRSTDTGVSFEEIPLLAGNGGTIVGVAPSNNDIVYAMDGTERIIYRSDDTGLTWREYVRTSWRMGLLDSRPCGFAVHPTNPDWIYTKYSTGDMARYDGASWTPMGMPEIDPSPVLEEEVGMIHFDPRHPEILYAEYGITGGPQVFRSVDGGSTWQDITFNLPRNVGGLKVHPLTGDVMVSSCCGTFILPAPYADADSIYPNAAGDAPRAIAAVQDLTRRPGGRYTAYDDDGDGYAEVFLDATGSYAEDSAITTHLWQRGEEILAVSPIAIVPLGVGSHEIRLGVYDTNYEYAYDDITITVVSALPGDADGDGHVNVNDFILLKQNYNIASGATWDMGDFNGDGAVDIDDFVILKRNYNR